MYPGLLMRHPSGGAIRNRSTPGCSQAVEHLSREGERISFTALRQLLLLLWIFIFGSLSFVFKLNSIKGDETGWARCKSSMI